MTATRERGRLAPALVVMVVLLGASAGLQASRDRWFARAPVSERLLYLQSGDTVGRLAGAYKALLADVYWIRTVQHYGSDRLGRTSGRRYELLYPLLDITTTLDPDFNVAYRFGAYFLADAYPAGAGRPDQAIALLQKGLRARPGKWEYAQDIGFIYYWAVGDYARAGQWYLRASRMPGAPDWMSLVAASFVAGVDRKSARFLWEQILETAEHEWMRNSARLRLAQFDAMDRMDALSDYLRPFADRISARPLTWARLARAGAIRSVPADPAGVPFDLDPWTGEVVLSRASPLHPIPEFIPRRPPGRVR